MAKPVLLDGSCGSLLWSFAKEENLEQVLPWIFNKEAPHLVKKMVQGYMDCGCEMVQTNTFSVNAISVQKTDYTVEEVVRAAVRIAKETAEGSDVKVYLSSGPLSVLLKPFGTLAQEDCREMYAEIFRYAVEEGVDAIALETFMDLQMIKIAAEEALKYQLPVFCSLTFGKKGKTLMGNSVQQICSTLEPLGVSAIGMNCSFGPVEAVEIIKQYKDCTKLPLYFKPNAGVGDTYSAAQFAQEIEPALSFVHYVGGCCGTNFDYIKELKRRIDAC